MKNNDSKEVTYAEIYIGTLDCVVNEQIYLTDAYSIEDDLEEYLEDEYKKWDLSREDPDVKEFPHIKLEYVDEIYACKHKFTLEQAWNVWSDPRDYFNTENLAYQKIQEILMENEPIFENNKPLYLNEKGNVVSPKDIFDTESKDGNPVTLIAVTRNQFDISRFPEFERYIKTELGYLRCYYGLWKDDSKSKPEYEVVYAMPNNDHITIQRHLNLHDELNDGTPQQIALVIFSDGSWEPVKNSK